MGTYRVIAERNWLFAERMQKEMGFFQWECRLNAEKKRAVYRKDAERNRFLAEILASKFKNEMER